MKRHCLNLHGMQMQSTRWKLLFLHKFISSLEAEVNALESVASQKVVGYTWRLAGLNTWWKNYHTEIRFVFVFLQAGNKEMLISQNWLDSFTIESHAQWRFQKFNLFQNLDQLQRWLSILSPLSCWMQWKNKCVFSVPTKTIKRCHLDQWVSIISEYFRDWLKLTKRTNEQAYSVGINTLSLSSFLFQDFWYWLRSLWNHRVF